MPPSGMWTPGHTRGAAQKFTARTDVGAVADDAVANQCARADAGTEADDRAFDDRPGLDRAPSKITAPSSRAPGADLRAAADDRSADQQRAGRDRRTVVHEHLAAMPASSAGDGAMPRTRSAEPRTKSSGVPMSRQYVAST